jgi:hypothetical protein
MIKYGNGNYERKLPNGKIMVSNIPISDEMFKKASEIEDVCDEMEKDGEIVKVIDQSERQED